MNNKKIIIGTWALAEDYWGKQKHSDSLKMLHAALRNKFYNFDTSPDYGKGKSETLLGQQLSKNNLCQISTKSFLKPESSFRKSIENSFKRLNKEVIDYFFIHWPSTKFDSRPAIEILEEYRRNYRIKFIGVSNFNKIQLKTAQEAGNINVVQNAFNFFWNNDIEYFRYCKSNDIETQAYSPLAQGLLTGKYNKNNPVRIKDSRHLMTLYKDINLQKIYIAVDKINKISESLNISTKELILAWTLNKNYIDSMIVGCRNRSQLEELLNLERITIDNTVIEQLNKISKEFNNQIVKGENIFNHSY